MRPNGLARAAVGIPLFTLRGYAVWQAGCGLGPYSTVDLLIDQLKRAGGGVCTRVTRRKVLKGYRFEAKARIFWLLIRRVSTAGPQTDPCPTPSGAQSFTPHLLPRWSLEGTSWFRRVAILSSLQPLHLPFHAHHLFEPNRPANWSNRQPRPPPRRLLPADLTE